MTSTRRICILALLGLPGAGKTTLSNWFLELPQNHFNVLHFCYDEFLPPHDLNKAKDFNFKAQRNEILKALEQLVFNLKTHGKTPYALKHKISRKQLESSNDFLIICDDNNYYRSMRYKLYQFCRRKSLAYAQIYLECDLGLALTRNEQRTNEKKLPQITLEQIWQRLEAPEEQKQGRKMQKSMDWEHNTLVLQAIEDKYSSELILTFIQKSFLKVLQPTPIESMPKPTVSSVHHLDGLLRKRIGELLAVESATAAKQLKAVNLNAQRKAILLDFKEKNKGEIAENKNLSCFVNLLH